MMIRQGPPQSARPPIHADAFALPGIAASARAARDLASGILDGWSIGPELVLRIKQALSEVVTNAVVHACPPGGSARVRVGLVHFAATIVVEVWDPDSPPEGHPPTVPHLVLAADIEEGGRGMAIVAAMADRWGVRREESGKTVLLLFDLLA